jgi:Domain of unknown function (DUF4328)
VFCYVCVLSYPAEVRRCPQCRTRTTKPLAFLPLQGLAKIVMVLLALVIGAIVLRLGVQLLGGDLSRWRYDSTIGTIDHLTNLAILVLSILFVLWFHRARVNAERLGYRQRHSPGWTFWGWLVPFVNLWFPVQIMGDIWRAGRPARPLTHLPGLWWTCWLVSALGGGMSGTATNSGLRPKLAANTWSWSLGLLALAGVLLIAIIRAVSSGPVGSPEAGRPVEPLPAWSG